jgi:hypothetical protein
MQTLASIVGVYIGAPDEAAAGKLWESLPCVYRALRDRIYGLLGSIWGGCAK